MIANMSKQDYTDRLSFIAEWYDYEAYTMKHFYLHYYPFDNSVELFDKDKNRIYLRRAACEGVESKDMFVGNTVRIYGRQVNLVDYADNRTKKLISKKTEKTFTIFKPGAMKDLGTILNILCDKRFKIVRLKMCELNRSQAMEFYHDKKSDPFLPYLVEHIVSGPILAAELIGEDAIQRYNDILGPEDPAVARKDAPDTLRAIYGSERASNGFHSSDTESQAANEANFFFPKQSTMLSPKSLAAFRNSTCCVIKPHAINEGKLGDILSMISSAGFKINAMEMFYLSNANADEFLEVYKGVVNNFNKLVLSFIDGPLVALEITGSNTDIHGDFRKFTGPSDPDVAVQIRPNTLRAKFGVDKYNNAVHCTDLPEDTEIELEYFFTILQN